MKTWVTSQGYTSPKLEVTDERQKARETREDGISRMQFHLQRAQYDLHMAIAQRCRGWTTQPCPDGVRGS
jgi:hypothetical protein